MFYLNIFEDNYYNSMLNKLNNEELVRFIKERNESFKNKDLEKFIRNKVKCNNIYKLTPAMVLYGD